jgi:AcrR family transcriptional regulator
MVDEGSRHTDATDDADLPELSDEARIYALLVRELGEQMADAFVVARETQERWERRRHPHDGLRERKKRRTRQQISDVATVMFVVRGFDHVKVSDIASIVGVSEKTVYNYFPTKESLVFDRADEGIARLAAALRERAPGESPTKAIVRALGDDMLDLQDLPDEIYVFLPLFSEMVAATPSLRAAMLDLQGRLVEVAAEELATLADVDPRDPEPMIAARAIVGLHDLAIASRMRHIEDGLRGRDLHDAVLADVERAARLLDAGLWSFNLLTQGARTRQQLRDAALAAEESRRQVLDALKRARDAWRQLRREEHGDARREREQSRRERRDSRSERGEAGRGRGEGRRERGEAGSERDELKRAAKRLAYEAFRAKLQERQDAIAERQTASRTAADERDA